MIAVHDSCVVPYLTGIPGGAARGSYGVIKALGGRPVCAERALTLGCVSLVPALYARFRQLASELGKFGLVGVLAFLVTDAGTNLLHFQAHQGPLTANVIATVVAMAVSYAGNRYWTFRDRERSGVRREGTMFFLLNTVGLVIQLACLGLATYLLGLHGKLSYNIALVAGIVLATLFRYWSYKQWVWRAATAPPAEWAPYAPAPQALAHP
jgi:putative flippase GtrA